MTRIAPTPRTRLRRKADRGAYDRATIDAILDEGFVCHVGISIDARPAIIPTVYARAGDHLYLHGSAGNRVLRAIRDGAEACISVTHVDGLVLARSAFHHSVNYRSVILYATGEEVLDPGEKLDALRAIVEQVIPHRWSDVRAPSREETLQTLVVRLPVVEASAKIRLGPPLDDEEDHASGCWAGVIPLAIAAQSPIDDPRLAPGIGPPAYVTGYTRPGRRDV